MTGQWQTEVPPVHCDRDCFWPGLAAGPDAPVADGFLYADEPHELWFAFEPNATGSVTLQLTDIP